MPHALWRGAISFGLVTIPVALYPATNRDNLAFHLLDRRDFAPIRQQRVNANTGEPVPWQEVVKGYEYAEGAYVALTDADFHAANVEASQTVDILHFVEADQIDPVYYDTPYYLEPMKPGRKAYALLRETLRDSGLVGIARLVIRTREHIAAVRPMGDALVADVLRYGFELRDPAMFELPTEDLAALKVSPQELEMAAQLVNAMVTTFDPGAYHDTYRDDVLAMIERKVASGETHEVREESEVEPPGSEVEVIDIMALLKRSVERAQAEDAAEKQA